MVTSSLPCLSFRQTVRYLYYVISIVTFFVPLTCLAEEVVRLLHDGRVHDGVEEGALLALLGARRHVLVVHVLAGGGIERRLARFWI